LAGKVKVFDIINYISDDDLEFLTKETAVDWNVKKLHGKELFKLLIFGVLNENRSSSRVFESFYENIIFQKLGNIEKGKKVSHSSIAERIGKVDVRFFEQIYEKCVEKFSPLFSEKEAVKFSIYDSTITSLSSELLKFGMQNGAKTKDNTQGKMSLKFTVGFSGLPFRINFHQEQKMISEDLALGDILEQHACSKNDVAVFDRGMKNRNVMMKLSENQQYFVTRIYKNSKFVAAKDTKEIILNYEDDGIQLLNAKKVHLFSHTRKIPVTFRLVEGILKDNNEKILFLSNLPDEFSEQSIASIYKNRWKIEQFFRFIKQEINFKHFFSRQWNGVKVMTYAILIASILLLVYIKLNKLKGYKIPKISFCQELQNEILERIVIHCGGDPSKIIDFSGG
jgi:hypothetical protein